MFMKQWEILLVDDDPDINRITQLAMRSFEVYGIPLKLTSAGSKAEAMELLSNSREWLPLVAVAFIDVVMETDTAGLELCDYIRNGLGNKLTQLYIRTGQPGVAPERRVIDDYDVNGYFTKLETNEDKLYSLVKAGVRQYYWSQFASASMQFFGQIIAHSGSRDSLAAITDQMLRGIFMTAGGTTPESMEAHYGVWIGEREVSRWGIDEAGAIQLRDRLSQMEGQSLGAGGASYVKDDQNHFLFDIGSPDPSARVRYVGTTQFDIPPFVQQMIHRGFAGLSKAWQVSAS